MAKDTSTIDAVRKAFSSKANVDRIESALDAVGEGVKDADADKSAAAKKIAAAKRKRAVNKARKNQK